MGLNFYFLCVNLLHLLAVPTKLIMGVYFTLHVVSSRVNVSVALFSSTELLLHFSETVDFFSTFFDCDGYSEHVFAEVCGSCHL